MEENKDKIVISEDDISNVEQFFSHFDIAMPERLEKELKVFKQKGKKYAIEDQHNLKIALVKAVIDVEHDLLKDEIFDSVKSSCQETWYNAQFDNLMEEALSGEIENKPKEEV